MRQFWLVPAFVLSLSASAFAADMPVKAVPHVYNWTGFYLGGHVGYGWTDPGLNAVDTAAINATYGSVPKPKGAVGGVQALYNWQLPNRIVVGIGLEMNGFGVKEFKQSTGLAGTSSLTSTLDWDIALYGRLGYAFDRFMLYGLFGGAWDHNTANGFNGTIGTFSVSNWHSGWTAGGGIEAPVWDRWTMRAQYRFVDVNTKTYLNRQISSTGSTVDIGLNYRF